MMRWVKVLVMVALLGLGLSQVGCGGGGAKVETRDTTLGQELIDLDAAYQKGLLTEEQYEKKKKELLKKN